MSGLWSYVKGRFYGTEEEETEYHYKEKQQVKTEANAAEKMQKQIKKLNVKVKYNEFKISQIEQKAKAALDRGDKPGAIALLKQKKQLVLAVRQLNGQIANLEQTNMVMESTATASDMVSVMKDSTAVMTGQMASLNVEDVEDVKTELNELTTDATEISNLLATPFNSAMMTMEDENDIARQLAEWEDQANARETDRVGDMLPSTPSRKLVNNNNNDGDNEGLLKN